jgi:PKD repeat protein
MMRWKSVLLFVAIFVLGALAGFGAGNLYGNSAYDARLEQKAADVQSRLQTVNDNYLTLVREYNKLFTLKAPAVAQVSSAAVPATPATAANTAATASPAAAATPATAAPKATAPATEAKVAPTAAAKATVAPTAGPTAKPATGGSASSASSAAGNKPKAEFKALAIDGTGPLEGPPPLLVRFTDLSTGSITSWKWEFGDGQTSTDQNPEHKFMLCPGDKKLCTVKLTVCGPDGCTTATKPDYLWVSEECSGC